ncbi:MAG: hypothetical protein ACI4PO_02030 [Faecousia sp.]
MMKQIFRDKTILLAFIVLLLCGIAIGYAIYSVLNPKPEEPVQYPLSTLMKHSFTTTIEQKAVDGTVSEIKINGDPVFGDGFSLEDEKYNTTDASVDTSQWIYRVTYWDGWEEFENSTGGKIVFLIGDGWFTLSREPDKVYTMQNMDAFLKELSKTYEYWYINLNQLNEST